MPTPTPTPEQLQTLQTLREDIEIAAQDLDDAQDQDRDAIRKAEILYGQACLALSDFTRSLSPAQKVDLATALIVNRLLDQDGV